MSAAVVSGDHITAIDPDGNIINPCPVCAVEFAQALMRAAFTVACPEQRDGES